MLHHKPGGKSEWSDRASIGAMSPIFNWTKRYQPGQGNQNTHAGGKSKDRLKLLKTGI